MVNRGRGFDSHKIFSLPRVIPCFPLLGLTPSGLFMGLSSTIIYTSESPFELFLKQDKCFLKPTPDSNFNFMIS